MTRHNENPSDIAVTLCRKCGKPIDARSEDDFLDQFGTFFRLRCTMPECGHTDWYKDLKPFPEKSAMPAEDQGSGEVWIHDAILGLSFRVDIATPNDAGFDVRDVQL